MRSVWITRSGGPEVLEVRTSPDPSPDAGEVRVRVRAAGLQFADAMARMGLYPNAPKPPCVIGYDFAGEVDALGPGVSEPLVGTRVLGMAEFGAHSDVVCVPSRRVFPMPEQMTFEEGAAFPVAYLTAYHILLRVAALRPGDRVLIHMAAGGVGMAALQLCRTVPGVTVFGSASASKHDALRSEGCHHPIDYRTVDYVEAVRRITDGEGVDVVLNPLGGADARKGYALLRPMGRLVNYGLSDAMNGDRRNGANLLRKGLSMALPSFSPMSLMKENRTVAGVSLGHLWFRHEHLLTDEMSALLELYGRGQLEPRIDSIFEFDRAADAHRRIQERANTGKVLLVP